MTAFPSFFEWLEAKPHLRVKPWLILGKGPTFGRLKDYDTSTFATLSLNHVVREFPVTVAHIIDLDVIDACADALLSNPDVVVLPWQPHRRMKPTRETLESFAAEHPVLRQLKERGRLAWYNLGSGASPRPGSPIVPVRYFSAEAALGLLAQGGIGVVRSLGVDGGAIYSRDFDDLADETLLSNGRTTFDQQFEEFPKILNRTGVDYAPLTVETPIRVYVAATESEQLPVKVLEYSIRKHCSMSVTVESLNRCGIAIDTPIDPRNQPRTPFSFQRFLIPEAAGRKGKAIYLDADMLVFQDMRRLWSTPMDGADILAVREPSSTGRQPQFSVMLLDCNRLTWNIREIVDRLDAGRITYEELMYGLAAGGRVARVLDASWNSLEHYVPGRTALLHYTDMNTQPWVWHLNPLGYLWERELLAAVEEGFIDRNFVAEHVRRGWVRPSLLIQIDEDCADGRLLGRRANAADRNFLPPYHSLAGARPSLRSSPLRFATSFAREIVRRRLLPAVRGRERSS